MTPQAANIAQLHAAALKIMTADAAAYLENGADDNRTVAANTDAWASLQIRCRRLIGVSTIDLRCEILGSLLPSPIALSPVGFQKLFA